METNTLILIIAGIWYTNKGAQFVKGMKKDQFTKDESEIPFIAVIFLFLFWPIDDLRSIIYSAKEL